MSVDRVFPEVAVGGFARRDGTVAFYTRVNALLRPDWRVLDLGAGRGEWLEDTVTYRRDLRNLRGKVSEVVGVDIDPVVKTNSSCDSAVVMSSLTVIPLDSNSVDMILCDQTFEHIAEPTAWVEEINRVLKPGGWVCARTPNRWGYIGVATNIVPNRHHTRVLTKAQPLRQHKDVFPTVYAMNTRAAVNDLFDPSQWSVTMVPHNPEPSYFGRSQTMVRIVDAVSTRLPGSLAAAWFIFVRKH